MSAETVVEELSEEQRQALERVAGSDLPVNYIADALLRGD